MMETERLHTAGDWLLRLQSEQLEQQDLAEWVEWYGAHSDNRAAFEKMQSDYETLRTMSREDKQRLAERLLGAAAEPPTVWQRITGWFTGATSTDGRDIDREPPLAGVLRFGRERVFAACIGACIAFAVSFGVWYVSPAHKSSFAQTAVYRTERGKHELVNLTDGSQVRVGAKSSIFVTYTDEGRYLVLEGGEAFFKVAHDSDRPFVVQAGSISIRAIGTEFSVRRAAERVMVTVSQGVVDVVPQFNARPPMHMRSSVEKAKDKVRITAGERVTLSSTDADLSVMETEPGAALAWQNGRLEFVDEPLRAVVATINRYSDRELILTDAKLGEMSFTGTVYEGRVDEWLEAIQQVFPVRVVSEGSDAILLAPAGKIT